MFDHIARETAGKIEEKVTTHWFRHTTVAQVDRIAGFDAAAQWAGHRPGGHGPGRGDATGHYIRWPIDELKALFEVMFPDTPPGRVDTVVLAEKFGWLQAEGLME